MSRLLYRRIRPEQVREISLVIVIFLVVVFFATQVPNFMSGRTFTRATTTVPITVVLGVGLTLVVLTRNIDLSIAAIVAVVSYGVGTLLAHNTDMHPAIVIALCVSIGTVLGVVNGLIVAYGGVPSIIATLGTLGIFRSILVATTDSRPVTTARLPAWMVDLNGVNVFRIEDLDVRVLPILAFAVVIVFQLLLRYAQFGRRLFAIGSNPDAAQVAGLPVKRDVFFAFVLCGALAGLAGFMYIARYGNVDTQAAVGLELAVVAAVVVGGVNIFGGSGSMVGVLLGAILVVLVDQGLIRWAAVSEFLRDALLGLLILFAVASDKIVLERLRLIWARARRAEEERDSAAITGPAGLSGPSGAADA
jgi:rhamnose transport system permease protein